MFLGIGASASNWNAAGTECSLTLDENPLIEFAELPEQYRRAQMGISGVGGKPATNHLPSPIKVRSTASTSQGPALQCLTPLLSRLARLVILSSGLAYANLLPGVLRGALEMVSLRVKARDRGRRRRRTA